MNGASSYGREGGGGVGERGGGREKGGKAGKNGGKQGRKKWEGWRSKKEIHATVETTRRPHHLFHRG